MNPLLIPTVGLLAHNLSHLILVRLYLSHSWQKKARPGRRPLSASSIKRARLLLFLAWVHPDGNHAGGHQDDQHGSDTHQEPKTDPYFIAMCLGDERGFSPFLGKTHALCTSRRLYSARMAKRAWRQKARKTGRGWVFRMHRHGPCRPGCIDCGTRRRRKRGATSSHRLCRAAPPLGHSVNIG